jgi:hypothetical protein
MGRSRNSALITENVAALAEAQVATTATALKGGKNTRIAKKALGVYARRILIATNVHAIAQAYHPETSQTFWLGSMSIESAVGMQVLDGQSVDSGVIVDESPAEKTRQRTFRTGGGETSCVLACTATGGRHHVNSRRLSCNGRRMLSMGATGADRG